MPDSPIDRDAISIRWGRFQASITGRLAIAAAALVVLAAMAGAALRLWS
jgi:hypothetical protein